MCPACLAIGGLCAAGALLVRKYIEPAKQKENDNAKTDDRIEN